ncbi:uncharacterized protein LOC117526189 isoform X2 [Thalassophryne amazonica]|uniref:uncharacterized protein LOC117526189 isoform X2 n=1 Tax=Thalassophryne amazonica TaxID=390379 RepID=UPI001470DB2E|nr:uncharacterized protein LOC117526189 isoform X2 [Thalassophryne amazonica]
MSYTCCCGATMTRAALMKLLILLILAFIICLPEFFTLYRVSSVSFICQPHRHCARGDEMRKREDEKAGDAKAKRKPVCDSSQTPGSERWEQACIHGNQSNVTDAASDSRSGSQDPVLNWYMCETDQNSTGLHSNISALKEHVEVSVRLLLRRGISFNLTLYGRSNHSDLYLVPSEDEEEEEKREEDAFYCCLPIPPTSETANHSRCLLWLANQTVLVATGKEKLSWKPTQKGEWRCAFRVLWLVLLCVVLLAVATIVLRHIYCKPRMQPVSYDFAAQLLKVGEKRAEISNTAKGMIPDSFVYHPRSGLATIQEVVTSDIPETLLHENVDHHCNANLHHRGHPSTSSLTEGQAW